MHLSLYIERLREDLNFKKLLHYSQRGKNKLLQDPLDNKMSFEYDLENTLNFKNLIG